jgi:chemotaxis protein MotB
MAKSETVVEMVRERRSRRNERSHGGAWKVAYADLVTAMMALFIVLWILNQDQSVVKAIGGYFKDPAVKAGAPGVGGPPGTKGANATGKINEEQFQEVQKDRFQQMAKQLSDELFQTPEFAGLADQVKFEIVPEGLRIEIVESANDIFFEIGTSQLKPNTIHLLEKIGGQLTRTPNKIVVEGHTDSRPYAGAGALTNFELSADRANAARRALSAGGLAESRIEEIRGCADRHLRVQSDPLNVVNRRISIIVKYGAQ